MQSSISFPSGRKSTDYTAFVEKQIDFTIVNKDKNNVSSTGGFSWQNQINAHRLTKLLIRRAFTDLVKQKPIQSISIKELCEIAGINRGTFYSHYTDIYDLLEKIEAEMLQDFQASLAPLLENDDNELTSLKITAGVFSCLKGKRRYLRYDTRAIRRQRICIASVTDRAAKNAWKAI